MEWMMYAIVNAYKISFNFTGPEVMIYGSTTYDGKNVDKDCAWMSVNSLIQEKFQAKLEIIAWVHSKFEGNEITSFDLHNQMTWSSMFPDILGLVIQLNEDGTKIGTFDFYALTMKGKRILSKCEKPKNQLHDECSNKALYKSCMDYVRFSDSSLEVIDDDFEVIEDDPMAMSADDIQTQTDELMEVDDIDEDDFCWNFCKGCKKTFEDSSKFCMHVSRAKCKEKYGPELTKWLEERKKSNNRKKQKTFKKNHPEIVSQNNKAFHTNHREEFNTRQREYQREYDANHREQINKKQRKYDANNREKINSKQRKYDLRIKNQAFEKRFLKFKEDTKDGPAFICNCCRRLLFKTGTILIQIFI